MDHPYAEMSAPAGPMMMHRQGRRDSRDDDRRGYEDRRARRHRSRSPMGDRYGHREHYGGYRDRHEPRPLPVNPIPDPRKLEYSVGFSYFGDWWRHNEAIKEEKERQRTGRRPSDRSKMDRDSREGRTSERAQIQAAYDLYKEEIQVKMARNFVQAHKNEEWFRERYIPSLRDDLRAKLNTFRKENYTHWERDMDSGTYDEFTLEGVYKGDSNGMGSAAQKEDGEAVASSGFLGVGDLVPLKHADIRDEQAYQPALLFKTVAPTVSRAKMEAFCKEHIGEADGGFKWLSLSDPNPSKRFHRIGWVLLHPGSEQPAVSERGDARDEDGEHEDGTTDAHSTSSSTAEKAVEAINGKTIHDAERGDFTCYVGVHVPPVELRRKALWDLFSAPERIHRDLQLAIRLVSKLDQDSEQDFTGLSKVEEKVEDLRNRGLLSAPPSAPRVSKKVRKQKDVLGIDTDGEDDNEDTEDDEDGSVEEGEESSEDDGSDDEDMIAAKRRLDLLVEYLRRVYNFCFYCVFESDSVHEMTRKCPGGHLRRPRGSLTSAAKSVAAASASGADFPLKKKDDDDKTDTGGSEAKRGGTKSEQQLHKAFNWAKTFEEKLYQILEPENVDVRRLGGRPVDEALDEELTKYVQEEDESKFRCRVPECTKLFRGETFWRKHVEKRHAEWYESLKQDLDLVNNYVLDPAHVSPSRPDQANNNQPFMNGTPRGFNMNGMGMSMGQVPGNMGNSYPGMYPPGGPAGYPTPFFGQHPVQMPGGWSGDFQMGPGGQRGPYQSHTGGPIRHRGGGGRGGNYRPGPYDRRDRGMRYPPQNMGMGMGMMPPGPAGMPAGGPMPGMGGAMPPAPPRPGMTGPKEAVQGRSLKTYEDLDAVAGGGGAGPGTGALPGPPNVGAIGTGGAAGATELNY